MFRSVILAVLLSGAASIHASTSAESRAKVWLRQHQAPDAAGLEDLKNSDPNSYAIVQALLMKQQAGLMDASNPGGFKHEEHESAADIMRAAPTIEGAPPSMSEMEYSAPVQHQSYTPHGNPLAFNAAKADDDVMSIIGGDAPSSSDNALQPISQAAMSVSVQPAAYTPRQNSWSPSSWSPSRAKPADPMAQNNEVLSILGGSTPGDAPPRSISEVSMSARHSQYIPMPQPHAQYNGRQNPLAFNAKSSDDDAMAIITGSPAPAQASLLSSRRTGNDDQDIMAMVGSGADLAPKQGAYYGISMNWGKKAEPAAPEPAAPVASMSQQNSYVAPQPAPVANSDSNPYLTGIDLGSSQPVAAAPQPEVSMLKKNSYMSQINFPMKRGEAEEAAAQVLNKGTGGLGSFSWDEYADVASGRVQVQRPPVQTQYIQSDDSVDASKFQRVEAKFEESKVKGALSDWLAPMHEEPAARKPRAEEKQEEMPDDPSKIDPMAIDKYNDWARSGAFA